MIKQPFFITKSLVEQAKELVAKKIDSSLLDQISMITIEEGLVVQTLHIGSFGEEYKSFEKINDFCESNSLTRTCKSHKEIYLSDFRKVSPDKLKTILRIPVINN